MDQVSIVIAVVVAAIAFRLFLWQKTNLGYRCPRCGKEFQLSRWQDYLGPNALGRKYLKCPECGRYAWDPIVKIQKPPQY